MASNTFFGEVNELNSRAIYWSDSEESDEESEEPHVRQKVNVVVKGDNDLIQRCDKIYISLSKSDKIKTKVLSEIGSIECEDISGIIGNMFAINKTSIWIRLNANFPTLKNHLLIKTIASLMKQIVSNYKTSCDPKTKPLVCIVSKDFSRDSSAEDVITYLANNKGIDISTVIPSMVSHRALLAPKMLTDLVESSVFEFCIVYDINCFAFMLSEYQCKPLDNEFIPKPIVDCVQQFNQVFDSNIYI